MRYIRLDDRRDFLAYRDGSGGSVEIYDIVVGSERRVGRGRRMVAALLAEVAGKTHLVWAMTRSDNYISACFYSSLSFRVVGTLRDFYPEGDAVIYGRKAEAVL